MLINADHAYEFDSCESAVSKLSVQLLNEISVLRAEHQPERIVANYTEIVLPPGGQLIAADEIKSCCPSDDDYLASRGWMKLTPAGLGKAETWTVAFATRNAKWPAWLMPFYCGINGWSREDAVKLQRQIDEIRE